VKRTVVVPTRVDRVTANKLLPTLPEPREAQTSCVLVDQEVVVQSVCAKVMEVVWSACPKFVPAIEIGAPAEVGAFGDVKEVSTGASYVN
jgi:hypothetical protein